MRAIRPIFLSGRSNPKLAKKVAEKFADRLGNIELTDFAGGEINCEIKEDLNGRTVYVVQTHHPDASRQIFEQALIIREAKNAGAKKIVAVCPFFGYSRQSQAAKLAADLLSKAGADQIVAVDLHEKVARVSSILVEDLFLEHLGGFGPDLVIVSPDAGRAKLAEKLSRRLGCQLARITKKRKGKLIEAKLEHGQVKSKICVLVDDIIDSGSTIIAAAGELHKNGAREIYCIATHGVFTGDARTRIQKSKIKEVIVSNTIDSSGSPKIKVVSTGQLIADRLAQD